MSWSPALESSDESESNTESYSDNSSLESDEDDHLATPVLLDQKISKTDAYNGLEGIFQSY